MTPEELMTPPTQPEIGDVTRALNGAGFSPLADIVRRLAYQLDQLREQSAREHAAWEAMRNQNVFRVEYDDLRERFLAVSSCKTGWKNERGTDPVDTVLAVVEAAKKDT